MVNFRFYHFGKLNLKHKTYIQIDIILGMRNGIFPGKYENIQINLFHSIQYNERSIVVIDI